MSDVQLGIAVSGVVGILTVLVGMFKLIQDGEKNSRESQLAYWNALLEWAKLTASDNAAVQALAHAALRNSGVSREELDRVKSSEHEELINRVFRRKSRPDPESARDIEAAIDRAEAAPRSVLDPDLQRVQRLMLSMETALHRAKMAGKAEDDSRIRIFFVLAFTASAYLALAVGAVRAALF